jgi:hypothetical protein
MNKYKYEHIWTYMKIMECFGWKIMKNHDPKVLWQATFTFGQGRSLNLIPKHAHLNMAGKFTATTSCIYSTQTKIDKQSGPL